MHSILQTIHHVASLVALLLFLFAFWRSVSGLVARGGWMPADEKARRFVPVALDIVFVLGLATWATLNPAPAAAFGPAAPAGLLFKAVVHPLLGCTVLALAHIGSVRARKLKEPRAKFRAMGLFYALAFLLIVAQAPFHN